LTYWPIFFKLRSNVKINTRQYLNTGYIIHALAKSATAEGIEFPSLSGRVRNLPAELSVEREENLKGN